MVGIDLLFSFGSFYKTYVLYLKVLVCQLFLGAARRLVGRTQIGIVTQSGMGLGSGKNW
jgi:hypothetical protein